jgi:type III pantothenate kinase
MILLLDLGNTRMKWALLEGGHFRPGGSVHHDGEDLTILAAHVWTDIRSPRRVVACNVAGPARGGAIATWMEGRWKIKPEFIRASAQQCGVTNAYSEPERLGADRWAALIAVNSHFARPACIIDCGTAITLDVLNQRGRHLGGMIVPGLHLMEQSVTAKASEVRINEGGVGAVASLADNTSDAVRNGILTMATAMVDKMLDTLAGSQGAEMACVITGGDAARILPHVAPQALYEPDLVLKGLAVMAGADPCVT